MSKMPVFYGTFPNAYWPLSLAIELWPWNVAFVEILLHKIWVLKLKNRKFEEKKLSLYCRNIYIYFLNLSFQLQVFLFQFSKLLAPIWLHRLPPFKSVFPGSPKSVLLSNTSRFILALKPLFESPCRFIIHL